ncbi:MAG: PEP-CTERM sorting domain-containing protein [Bryobacteraceae bacterium]
MKLRNRGLAFSGALLLGALLVVTPGAQAGSVTLGSYDSGNCYPFMCNDSQTSSGISIDYQQVYALSVPMTITSLSFQYWPVYGNDAVLGGTYDVYFSYSANPVGSLSSDLPTNVSGSQTLFFSGNLGGLLGDFTINGTTSFTYDPINGPLLLEVVVTDQALVANGNGNGYNWADEIGVVTDRAYYVPNTAYRIGSTVGALVTTFNSATVPEPSTLAFMGGGLLLLLGGARRRFNRRG